MPSSAANRRALIPCVAIAALGVAACGSSSSSSTTSSSSGAPTGTTTASRKAANGVPSRTYRLKLTGAAETPPGAPKGTGRAIVTLHGRSLTVCWRFYSLHGFSHPTFAHIHLGPAGTPGAVVVPLSTGTKFLHKGCAPATAALIKAITANPHGTT